MRPRILLVEPMRWLRETEEELLIRNGFHPCPAASAEEALAQAAFHPPAAVVTRFQLGEQNSQGAGGVTGIDLITALHLQGCYAPVIGLTGRKEHAEAFTEKGALAVLDMPFNASTLLDAIRRVLAL
jgi:DNA-binding NtrC family response regulator